MLAGYRTKIAAVGLMLSGVGAIAAALATEGGIDWDAAKAGAVVFFNGLGLLGLRLALPKE